jgi:hypothetical protein
MTRCRILVEGQTEEAFINRVVAPHLMSIGYHDTVPVVIATKRPADGGKHRGGVARWEQIERELRLLCRDSGAVVTSMVDLYRLPAETPGFADAPAGPPRVRVEHIEQAMGRHIGQHNLIPHVMLHEFETLLYADPDFAANHFGKPEVVTAMRADVSQCGEPEAVDEGPDTAPSKRIERHMPGFLKSTDGPTIASEIGLARLRAACPHFDQWIAAMEAALP